MRPRTPQFPCLRPTGFPMLDVRPNVLSLGVRRPDVGGCLILGIWFLIPVILSEYWSCCPRSLSSSSLGVFTLLRMRACTEWCQRWLTWSKPPSDRLPPSVCFAGIGELELRAVCELYSGLNGDPPSFPVSLKTQPASCLLATLLKSGLRTPPIWGCSNI